MESQAVVDKVLGVDHLPPNVDVRVDQVVAYQTLVCVLLDRMGGTIVLSDQDLQFIGPRRLHVKREKRDSRVRFSLK